MEKNEVKGQASGVYPLFENLPISVLSERLSVYGEIFHAIRARRELDLNKERHILVKDNIAVGGFTTTAGSRALLHFTLPQNPAITKLIAAGYDIFGKTNLTEFAGFLTTNRIVEGYSSVGGFGKNPHGNFACGGSSSGSAIAVAAGLCDAALGTETKGSLMIPGLRNGVFAFKPTVGLISRRNVVPISHNFDTIGILARSMSLILEMLPVLAGEDSEDFQTEVASQIDLTALAAPTKRIRIGVLQIAGDSKLDSESEELFKSFLEKATKMNIEFVPVIATNPKEDYELITSVDFAREIDALLSRYATGNVPGSFATLCECYERDPTLRPFGMNRLLLAKKLSSEVTKATYDEKVKETVFGNREAISQLLKANRVDVLLNVGFIPWWALSGAPSLAMPIGKKVSGEPVGVMLGTAFTEDAKLLRTGLALEKILRNNSN